MVLYDLCYDVNSEAIATDTNTEKEVDKHTLLWVNVRILRVAGAENLRPEGVSPLFFEAFFRLQLFKNGSGIIPQDGFQLKQHYGTKKNITHKEEIFMQTVRKLRKRSGFTLVELLIVIIIIGILAGAMLLVAGSGTDKAEATKIISDLRSLKSAALMFYADGGKIEDTDNHLDDLKDYMDRKMDDSYYTFIRGTTDHDLWFVGRLQIEPTSGIAESLAKTAVDSGLLAQPVSGDMETNKYNKTAVVYMRAR